MESIEYIVAEINQLTSSHIRLWIAPIDKVLQYEAGQYLKILYPNNEFMPFSMANAPTSDGVIELHIRIMPQDLNTKVFVQQLQKFSKIIISGPFGHCFYQKNSAKSVLVLAAGTGFAPAKAIIEKIITSKNSEEVHLYWTVKKPEDFYLPDLPIYWQTISHNFFYTPVITQGDHEISAKKIKIIDAVRNDYVTLLDRKVYVFGPYSLAFEASKLFFELGLKREYFYTDML